MGISPRDMKTAPLVLGGGALGAVTGLVMAGLMVSPYAAPFPDFTVYGVALMGGTVGAAVGLLLGGVGGLVMRLLATEERGVVAAAVGVAVGSVVLAVLLPLGLTTEATRGALATAGLLGFVAAALAWWSGSRSRGRAERP